MNRREDMLLSLRHRQPDKTPYQIEFTQKAREKTARFLNDPEFYKKIGNSLTSLDAIVKGNQKNLSSEVWTDAFGVQWDKRIDKDIGNVCNRLITSDNIDNYRFPDYNDIEKYVQYKQIIKKAKEDTFVVINLGFSLFERAWTLTGGMEKLLVAMACDKKFSHKLFDRILEFNLKVIEKSCEMDIDAMMFGDDWGQQHGTIMSPPMWDEFIKPGITQMYQTVKAKGKYVFIHSCGKVDGLFPKLIEAGLDVFNPFQPEVMDVFEMKKKYGDVLSFFGGISTQKTLPYGTKQQVRNEVKKLIESVGKNGGYIAAPAHAIPGDAKEENIITMIEVLQNQ